MPKKTPVKQGETEEEEEEELEESSKSPDDFNPHFVGDSK